MREKVNKRMKKNTLFIFFMSILVGCTMLLPPIGKHLSVDFFFLLIRFTEIHLPIGVSPTT